MGYKRRAYICGFLDFDFRIVGVVVGSAAGVRFEERRVEGGVAAFFVVDGVNAALAVLLRLLEAQLDLGRLQELRSRAFISMFAVSERKR